MNNFLSWLLDSVLIFLFFLIFIVLPIGLLSMTRFSSTHEGQHTGYITAVEQKGYFYPNYRVYVKTDNSSSQEDAYCMDRSKSNLAQEAKLWSKGRNLVEVTFDGVRGFGMGLCHGVQITDIKLVK